MKYNREYAWKLPLFGFCISMLIGLFGVGNDETSRVVGFINGGIILMALIGGIVGTVRCFRRGNKGHGIGGVVANLLLIGLIAMAFDGHARYQKMLPKYICNENLSGYSVVYQEKKPKLICSLPEGYEKVSEDEIKLEGFCTMKSDDDKYVLGYKKIGGNIKQNDPGYLKYLDKKNIKHEFYTWHGYEVCGAYVYELDINGNRTLTLNVQVPTFPEALQVTLFGLKAEEQVVESKMKEVLDGIEGFTDWKRKS